MRLTTLSLSLLTVGLTACASLPQSSSQAVSSTAQNINQQATTALNSLYTQPNYNFNARMYGDLQFSDVKTDTANTQKQQQIIEQFLRQQKIKLNNEHHQALLKQVEQTSSGLQNSRMQAGLSVLQNIAQYGELHYNGGIDFRNKRAMLEMQAHYQDANLLVQYRLPFFLDLQQNRVYMNDIDSQKLSGKAKQDVQSYYYDFSEHKEMLKAVNWKAFGDYLKVANALYYENLIGQESVQQLKLTDEERKLGAVQKVRLNTSLEELVLENAIFEIVNKKFSEEKLLDLDKLKAEANKIGKADTAPKAEPDVYDSAEELFDKIYDHLDSLEVDEHHHDHEHGDEHDHAEVETEQGERLAEPYDGLSPEQCRELVQNKPNFGTLTECYQEYGSTIFNEKSSDTSLWANLFNMVLGNDEELNKTFAQYDNGELKTIEQFKEILAKHQDVIQKRLPKDLHPVYMDTLIDAQGRLVGSNMVFNVDSNILDVKHVKGTVNFDMAVQNYGQAKVSLTANAKNAKPFTEHPFALASKKGGHQYNYGSALAEDIAQSVYQQTKSYEQAYVATFISLLSHHRPEFLNYVSAKDLQEIALVYAYSYADEELYMLKPAQVKHIQALEKKHNLRSSRQMLNNIGSQTAEIVEEIIQPVTTEPADDMVNEAQKAELKKKFKTPESLFAHLYVQRYEVMMLDGKLEAESQVHLDKAGQFLAKAYADLRQNKFDDALLKQLTVEQGEYVSMLVYVGTVELVESIFPVKK